jgi:hypothetical protein
MEFNFGNLTQTQIDKLNVYLEDLKTICADNNIRLELSPEPFVTFSDGGIKCNGYFDDTIRTLACAMGKDISQWLFILIHESSHMDQFFEQVEAWTNNNNGMGNVDKWINGASIDNDLIESDIKASMECELDCEKRTVEKLKKYDLGDIIDIENYIQKSNAYILFYLWMKKNRKWYSIGKEPYNQNEIVEAMPKTFDIDYTTLSPELEIIFSKFI